MHNTGFADQAGLAGARAAWDSCQVQSLAGCSAVCEEGQDI